MKSRLQRFEFSPRGRLARTLEAARRAPLLLCAFAGILGIALVDAARPGLLLLAAIALGGGAALCRRLSREAALLLAAAAAALLLLGWRHHLRLGEIRAFPLASALLSGQEIEIEGEAWIADSVEWGDRSLQTAMHLEKIVVGGRSLEVDHRVPCWIQKLPEELGYGRRVKFSGLLLPLEGPRVPGGFDAADFYFRHSGSLGRLEIRSGDSFSLLPGRRGHAVVAMALEARETLEAALLLGVPPSKEPYGRLVAAMVLGARENSPEELEEAFRLSGTMHLFAVSGLNVAIVALILTVTAAWLGIPKARAVPWIIPAILFYAAITGLSASAVRAALMASIHLAGYALREKPRLSNSLGLAALLLLAVDTQPLFLPGFQLSFSVVLFIFLLAPPLSERIARPFLADPFLPQSLIRPARRCADHLSGWIAALAAVSLASWLGSFGLLAWHFENVAPVGIVANLFMVPLATGIMTVAAATLTAHGLHLPWIVPLGNRINLLLSMGLTWLAQFFASWPGATVHTGWERTPAVPGLLRLDLVGDRGEGAALAEFPVPGGGPPLRWILDTGGARTYQGRMLPLLRHRGINRIDAMLLTHGDEGHLGGAVSALNQFRPALLFESSVENRSPSHPGIVAAAERLGTTRVLLDRGQRLQVGAGVTITVLHPDASRPGRLADDRALVLKVEFAGRTALLTSDSGFDTENALLRSGADVRADVWIRGQHADGPSALPAFVEAVAPRAVVSTHTDFPASERIPESLRSFLRERGVPLFELESAGTVSVTMDDAGLRITPYGGTEKAVEFGPLPRVP